MMGQRYKTVIGDSMGRDQADELHQEKVENAQAGNMLLGCLPASTTSGENDRHPSRRRS